VLPGSTGGDSGVAPASRSAQAPGITGEGAGGRRPAVGTSRPGSSAPRPRPWGPPSSGRGDLLLWHAAVHDLAPEFRERLDLGLADHETDLVEEAGLVERPHERHDRQGLAEAGRSAEREAAAVVSEHDVQERRREGGRSPLVPLRELVRPTERLHEVPLGEGHELGHGGSRDPGAFVVGGWAAAMPRLHRRGTPHAGTGRTGRSRTRERRLPWRYRRARWGPLRVLRALRYLTRDQPVDQHERNCGQQGSIGGEDGFAKSPESLAPRAGLEPATNRLTADRSTS
jgi:hypothetical protein